MNNVCLCIGEYADTPYYIKVSDIYVYSIEELCYYFMDKVHMLDDSIVTMELVKWIGEECGLTELAEELELYARKHVSVAAFVSTILEKTGMYDENIIKRIDGILKEQMNMTPLERYKKQAQYMYKQGRFKQALDIYSALLDYVPSTDKVQRAQLYYNMASIYAMDFSYAQAAEFYYEAYLLQPEKQNCVAYILANRKAMTDYAYGNFKRENPDWEQEFFIVESMCSAAEDKWNSSKEKKILDNLYALKDQGKVNEYSKQSEELIKKIKKDYRRQTQV